MSDSERDMFIEKTLRKAKEFAKSIRQYLYEQEQVRQLTDQEKKFYEQTHNIHIHTEDSLLWLLKKN